MDDQWIAARQLFDMLRADDATRRPEARLIDGLRFGEIKARAGLGEVNRSSMTLWRPVEEVRDWDIPRRIWNLDYNQTSFDLRSGEYSTSLYGTGFRSVSLLKLRFSRADVMAFFEFEEPKPAAPYVAPSALAKKNCLAWLEETYAENTGALPTKEEALTLALEKWHPGLSERAFKDAWKNAAKQRPWMSVAGRRKRSV